MPSRQRKPAQAPAARTQLPARRRRNHAARAAGRSCSSSGCRPRWPTPTPTCRCCTSGWKPRVRGRPTSAAWPTSPCCRSPSRPTCATSTRSACSPARTSQLARLHASSGTTGKPTVVGYTHEDIDNWADLMARSMYCGRRAPRRRGAQRLRLRPVHRRPGRALRRRAAGRRGGAGVGRLDRAPGGPHHGLQGARAVRHALVCAGDRRGGRAAGRRPAQERAARSACSAPSPGARRCATRSRRASA